MFLKTPMILRWTARLSALLVAGMYLLLLAGEIFTPHSGPPSGWREWTGIALMAVAVLAPLLAWKWELPGALLSLAALAAFVAVVHFRNYGVLWVMAMPGVLFLLDFALQRRLRRASGA